MYTGHAYRRTSATLQAQNGDKSGEMTHFFGSKTDQVANRYIQMSKKQVVRMATLITGEGNSGSHVCTSAPATEKEHVSSDILKKSENDMPKFVMHQEEDNVHNNSRSNDPDWDEFWTTYFTQVLVSNNAQKKVKNANEFEELPALDDNAPKQSIEKNQPPKNLASKDCDCNEKLILNQQIIKINEQKVVLNDQRIKIMEQENVRKNLDLEEQKLHLRRQLLSKSTTQ